jgi:glycosyltransferase involved in cell wall biosynthesis
LIVIYHNNKNVLKIESNTGLLIHFDKKENIAQVLMQVAIQYPTSILVWCNHDSNEEINWLELPELLHHNKMMLSYNSSAINYFGEEIGYVEESPFIKVNKKVSYPTWQMSSLVGSIHASVLLLFKDKIKMDANFEYYLCSIAKNGMPLGLLCYSTPRLLKQGAKSSVTTADAYTRFRFVKQHFKTQWVFLLLLNLMLYERKFLLLPFLFSLFYKNRTKINVDLDNIKVKSSRKVIDQAVIDVIIPTIGRKGYLYDVLKDFSKQTLLPKKIIIVEQNPKEGSSSELDYLTTEKWPFEIYHIFTHQAGACNARNLALNEVDSEWVFLADDDNRFESSLLSDIFSEIEKYGNSVVTTSYLQKNEIKKYTRVIQWPTFGAGNSFVRKALLDNVKFNMGLEFGYGEDADFGMQLRNQGHDVLYLPEPEISHLKAPVGGFRTKPKLQWQNDSIQPKPSPTVMLYRFLHNSSTQINSYKTTLFFKYYRLQKIKNPFNYYVNFQKQWERSVFWANELNRKE